jgi:reactive intermediate/imine deaminase
MGMSEQGHDGSGGVRRITKNARLPFSAGVQVDDLLFLSGEIGVDGAGTLAEGMKPQVDQAMANLKATLADVGATLGDIIKCTVMLRDMSRWEEFNTAYLEHFAPDRLPARSAFGGVDLAFGAEFEIECIAHLPNPAEAQQGA